MAETAASYRLGDYTIDIAQRTCSNGSAVDLNWRAFEALRLLVEARGAIVEKETFFEVLWPGVTVEESSLAKCIGTLRKGLNRDGIDYIETVPRVGYRLAVPVTAGEAPAVPPAAPASRRWWPWALAAALALALLGGAAAWKRSERLARADFFSTEGTKLLALNRPADFPAAVQAFRQAIQLNPNEANYHASMAEALGRLPRGPGFDTGLILQAAERAVELDGNCAGCQAVLGFVLFNQRWEWERAGTHMRRAVELDPKHPGKRGYLAMQMASQGKLEEALAEVDRGISIQPYQSTLHTIRSVVLCGLGRYEGSIAAASRAISFKRLRDSAWDWRAYSMFQLDRRKEGVMSYVHRLFENEAPAAETVISKGGVEAGLRWLLAKTGTEADRPARGVNRAHWKLLLGDPDGALEELKSAESIRHFELVYLAVNPAFRPLREHQEFKALLARMKLEHVME